MLRRMFVTGLIVFVGGSAANADYVDLVLTDPGIVSYWRFDDDTFEGNSAAKDETGANPGFYPEDEGVEASDDAILGKSAYFNGEPFQVIEIENEENFDFEDTMSVEAWFKVDDFFDKNWQAIVNKGDDQWRLHRRSGECGLAFGRDENGTNNKDTVDSGVCVDDGEWHQAVAVFDNAESLTALLYVDGELVADGPDDETIGPLNTEEGANVDLPVMIGGNAQDGNHWRSWTGWIDEVSIYNRALSAQDVLDHYKCGLNPDDCPPDGGELKGDFNSNGMRDPDDVDLLAAAAPDDLAFDLNGDNVVNDEDRRVWVEDLTNTYFGDATFDGEFSSADFVKVFSAAKYETGAAAKWVEGDWNGDGVFSSSDFVIAFSGAGYEQGPREGGLMPVPEPTSLSLVLAAMMGMLGFVRKRR